MRARRGDDDCAYDNTVVQSCTGQMTISRRPLFRLGLVRISLALLALVLFVVYNHVARRCFPILALCQHLDDVAARNRLVFDLDSHEFSSEAPLDSRFSLVLAHGSKYPFVGNSPMKPKINR